MAQQQQKLLFYGFAPDSNATLKYGRFLDPVPGFNAISTSGSSTTVTGVNNWRGSGSTTPFAGFTVGTLLFKRTSDTAADVNIVSTVTSDSSIVIASAKDYSGGVGGWWHQIFKSGTETTDGWMVCQNARRKAVKITVTALSSAGVTYSVEGKGWNLDQAPYQIITGALASATFPANTIEINVLETVAALRVGLRTTSGAPNTADAVTVTLIERVGPQEYEG